MGVRTRNNILFLDFYCYLPDGRKIRCRESSGLNNTKKNRGIIEAKNKAIMYELKHGRFDYLHFFPHGAKAHLFRGPTEPVLFSDWWDQWISEKSLRENTERSWNSSYRVHIGPYFRHMLLSQITEHEILVFRKTLEPKLKASSINDKIIKPLCMCLYRAYKRGLLKHYPCDEIGRLKEDPVDIDPFNFDELKAFLKFLSGYRNPMYHDLVFIWSRTGLRPGEMYALKWPRIDYFNRKILIRETRYPSGQEGPPKTKHSIRDVELRPPVLQAIRRQEARTGLMDSYVFMTEASKPFSDAFMRKKFRHLLKLAKIKYRPPEQMRHTFATLHLAAGENPRWVAKQVGHSSTKITHERYERFVPNLTRDDGSAFEKIMDSKRLSGHNQGTSDRKSL